MPRKSPSPPGGLPRRRCRHGPVVEMVVAGLVTSPRPVVPALSCLSRPPLSPLSWSELATVRRGSDRTPPVALACSHDDLARSIDIALRVASTIDDVAHVVSCVSRREEVIGCLCEDLSVAFCVGHARQAVGDLGQNPANFTRRLHGSSEVG
jgi:hypothetical protein